ncbi:protein-glutamate O-methyltransferase CheR [Virgibacillus necropolis]|uniref:CheR family methyltransferase n=1 Tax=Virgibacillus necropolis TaxID=163877 RepID=UPI0038512099
MSEEYNEFILQIKRKLGVDLSLYKETQMKRRITSLRDRRGYTNFHTYGVAMNKDHLLLQEFVDRLTINVSEFYRNPKRWHILQSKILPLLFQGTEEITIWSAACSTGEEPYSLAMVLTEYFPNHTFKIIATDIDEQALAKAKQGIYQEQALKDLPTELKNKYFTVHHDLYHIDPKLKRMILFKKHNLLADRFPNKVNLIVCRNVLIYFTDTAKEIIYSNFSKSLVENGVLFVGSTEQIFTPQTHNLSLIDTFFYQKK